MVKIYISVGNDESLFGSGLRRVRSLVLTIQSFMNPEPPSGLYSADRFVGRFRHLAFNAVNSSTVIFPGFLDSAASIEVSSRLKGVLHIGRYGPFHRAHSQT